MELGIGSGRSRGLLLPWLLKHLCNKLKRRFRVARCRCPPPQPRPWPRNLLLGAGGGETGSRQQVVADMQIFDILVCILLLWLRLLLLLQLLRLLQLLHQHPHQQQLQQHVAVASARQPPQAMGDTEKSWDTTLRE